MSQAYPPSGTVPNAPVIMGHPAGLYVLFMTEMWERFSFYGMRGLLVLYMVKQLFAPDANPHDIIGYDAIYGALSAVFGPLEAQPLSSQLYGLYTGFVYLTPVAGGILADRLLGQRITVVIGGVLMAIGQFLLFWESFFFLGLFFLILGNGAFKPNISTQVGNLYVAGDPRRDQAFSIFYVGINLGAFLSNPICATLAFAYGFKFGFLAAGAGMLLGLVVYLSFGKYLAQDNLSQGKTASGAPAEKQPLSTDEKRRVWALVVLCVLNVIFWAVYEQQGNTMQLWAENQTVWPVVFGFQIPSPWYQSFNPLMIMIFTPAIAWFWTRQANKGTEPTSVQKMAIGCFVLGISFVVMVIASNVVGEDKGSMFWLLSATTILTVGELYLSPIGLSLVTKVAPTRMVSMMMGVWFLSSFVGNYLSGFIGSFYSRMPRDAFFMLLTALGVGAGVAMWILNKPLQRSMHVGEEPAKQTVAPA